MGKLADALNVHLQAPDRDDPAAPSPEERKASWYKLCLCFKRLRMGAILPAMGEAHDALRSQGRRARVFIDKSERYRGSGDIPAALEFDVRPMQSGDEGQPLECRLVFRMDAKRQQVCIERSQGGLMRWPIADAALLERDKASGTLRFAKTERSAWLERETYLPLEELTPERVSEEILLFVKATTGG
jgi:hypothetical protein